MAPDAPDAPAAPLPIAAAQYVRASTEHQRYSAEYQMAANAEYASARNIEIVRTYHDEAKSGLTFEGRPALRQLLADVVGGAPGYRAVLVYDISRWGRFQDIDESAHYEFLCRQAGVEVRYCAEAFENDGTAVTAVFKAVKRVMAADFSRDLSARVYRASCLSASKGFHHGSAPYGFRRMLVDAQRKPKCLLQPGERKFLMTDRVVLVPGPAEERETVRRMFQWFVEDGVDVIDIARRLTAERIPNRSGGIWQQSTVRNMLKSEIYVGIQVYGKTTQKMRAKSAPTPPSAWIRNERAVEPIVDPRTFERAQKIFSEPVRYLSNDAILTRLKALYAREGRISERAIQSDPGLPCGPTIRKRLGSTDRLHALVGSVPTRGYRCTRVTVLMRRLEHEAIGAILGLEIMPVRAAAEPLTALLRDTVSLRVYAAQPSLRPSGDWLWTCALSMATRADWNLVIRCDVPSDAAHDFLLLPRWGYRIGRVILPPELAPEFAAHRFDDLAAVLAELPLLRRLPPPEDFCRGPSKYLALRSYLESVGEDVITVSMPELTQVLGFPLPRLAQYRAWWSNYRNPKIRSVQAKAWMGAGYMGFIRPEDGTATFRRMTAWERELSACRNFPVDPVGVAAESRLAESRLT